MRRGHFGLVSLQVEVGTLCPPGGSVRRKNAVLACNWRARALEHLRTGPARLVTASYLDGVSHPAPAGLQETVRSTAEEALTIFGWKFKKGAPFAGIFTSLKVISDLRCSSDQGVIPVLDEPERADRVDEVLSQRKKAGTSPLRQRRPSAANGGSPRRNSPPTAGGPIKEFNVIAAGAGVAWSSRCVAPRRYWMDFLGAPPRRLPTRGSPPLTLISTDGAAEGEGRGPATIGDLLVLGNGSPRCFGAKVLQPS